MKKWYIYTCLLCLLIGCSANENEQKELISIPVEDPVKTVSMTFTGDLLFEQGLYDYWDNYQFGTYFDKVKPYLKGDIVVGNQEVPIGGKALDVSGVAFSFNAPEEIAQQLPVVGFDVMTLSNNHSYDRGYEGVVNTLKNLQEAGIETAGLYANEEDSNQLKIIEKNGIKIAILAYTYDTNIPIENEYSYIVKTFLNDQQVFDDAHKQMIQEDVQEAKEKADVVIAAMHWGTEFTYHVNQTQLDATIFLNELGVDLIIGNHPHNLQPMEIVTNDMNSNQTTVFYSLGNFVASSANVARANEDFKNMYEMGAILNLDIDFNTKTKVVEIKNMELTPFINHFENDYINFELIPFCDYTDELAAKHYQREYSDNFNMTWLQSQIDQLYKNSSVYITK